jgi:hypothetical protein
MSDLASLVEDYGSLLERSLSGPGEAEAALSQPVTGLIIGYAREVLNLDVVMHEEVREDSGTVRPDYGIRVNGLMSGHLELKKPGTSLDPSTYGVTSHNGKQWQRLRNLPNLLHTNGLEWRLWRYGELVGDPVAINVPKLISNRGKAVAPQSFSTMLTSFLQWKPSPIFTVGKLVDTIAPLAVMLREEVLESLKADRRYAKAHNLDEALRPFVGLRRDWRASLYPNATDEEFADGFAQTVVFALVIALSEGLNLDGLKIPEISEKLQARHTLLGRALNLLTEHVSGSTVGMGIETIIRALSVTQWDRISQGKQDVYLHLYEHFLGKYNPDRRKLSGSFYTPVEVVDAMTQLADQALKTFLDTPEGLSADSVAVIDPAMGTGTYPLSVLRHIASDNEKYGSGAVSDAISSAANRIYGIELQSGPYSVAELRLTQAIRDMGGSFPENGLKLYVADTLEDPNSASSAQLGYTLQLIAEQRREANKVKLETPIQVCIGNPPYKDKAQGMGGWIEAANFQTKRSPLDDFRLEGNGRNEYVLKNLYVYFWRWALWKVFESTPESTSGVVCFITATGYLNGPGFKGMRKWIRKNTSRGWIINLTPEGKQPPANTAIFNIETPVAIALFVRDTTNNPEEPAEIKYTEIHGRRENKFAELQKLTLSDSRFQLAGGGWTDGFVPAANGTWLDHPGLNDLFPWAAPGIKPNKTWVYNPSADILEERWNELLLENDPSQKMSKFKETAGTSIYKGKDPLPGDDTVQDTSAPIANLQWPHPTTTVRVGFRSYDRQHIIADSRAIERARPELWEGRTENQLFMVEQHAHFPEEGPGVMFTSLIPDMHFFNGRGGRVLPLYHPDGSSNTAPELLDVLSDRLAIPVSAEDLANYIAGVSAHSGYVSLFSDELRFGANRVPITTEKSLWESAVEIGQKVIWAQTFGHRKLGTARNEKIIDELFGVKLPKYDRKVGNSMPDTVTYDAVERRLYLSDGIWSDVDPRVWEYKVGGNPVIDSWVGYRRRRPRGKKTSPLNDLIATNWPSEWSKEFHEVLCALTYAISFEEEQMEILKTILEGRTMSVAELELAGVSWPQSTKDRNPRRGEKLF